MPGDILNITFADQALQLIVDWLNEIPDADQNPVTIAFEKDHEAYMTPFRWYMEITAFKTSNNQLEHVRREVYEAWSVLLRGVKMQTHRTNRQLVSEYGIPEMIRLETVTFEPLTIWDRLLV